jgi:diguanylate cyclase (GGDEF)-like protein
MSGFQKPILIVDDDSLFRSSVVEILNSHGLSSVQAGSGEEANVLLQEIDPVLAIVDYRLPKQDGISWITHLRETGKNFPIIFISNDWCDPKTFNWLRSILKVSLVLQKPVVPELFLQQIEGILPVQVLKQAPLGGAEHVKEVYAKTQVDLPSLAGGTDAEEAEHRRIEQQNKLAIIKANYAIELAQSWDELSKAIGSAKGNSRNLLAINEARSMAHRLAGTAGSLGFRYVGELAAKIEHLLSMLDPADNLQSVLWGEILHDLSEGAEAVSEAARAGNSPSKPRAQMMRRVILYGKPERYKDKIHELNETSSADIELASELIAGSKYSKKATYDAAIFDLSMAEQARVFQVAREIRSMPGYASLPLGFISESEDDLEEVELVYTGCSELVFGIPEKEEIKQACDKLLLLGQAQKPRIVAVDDDESMTSFIADILHSEGMIVATLNNPIETLNLVNDFKPDLILLDVVMPGLSGYDVCRMLRNSEQAKSSAIVFLTSKTDKDGRAAAFQAGGNDFLGKPVVVEELIERVKAQVTQVRKKLGAPEKDQLTGVRSSIDFVKSTRELIDKSAAEDGTMTLCLLKVDEYSNIVTVHGYQAAQETLIGLGNLIQSRFRAEEIRGRFGEDGFGIAFPSGQQDIIASAMEKLLEEYGAIKFFSGSTGNFRASFSAGLAQYPDGGTDFQALLNTANRRLISAGQVNTGTIVMAN